MNLSDRLERVPQVGLAGLDQVVSGMTNSIFALLVSRSLGLEEFGRFAVALVVLAAMTNGIYSFVTEPALRFLAGLERSDHRTVLRAYSAVPVLAVPIAVFVGFPLILFGGATLSTVGVVLLGATGLLLHESVRQISVALGRAADALFLDVTWLFTSLGVLAVVELLGSVDSASSALVVWMSGAHLAIALFFRRQRIAPTETAHGVAWIRQSSATGSMLTAEGLLLGLSAQVVVFVLAAGVGLEFVGLVRSIELVFAVAGLLAASTRLIGQPRFVRQRAARERSLGLAVKVTGIIAAGVAANGLVVLLVGSDIGRAIVGERWDDVRDLVWIGGAYVLARAYASPALFALRVFGVAKLVVLLRVANALVLVGTALIVVAAQFENPRASLVALAIGNAVAAGLWYGAFSVVDRRASNADSHGLLGDDRDALA